METSLLIFSGMLPPRLFIRGFCMSPCSPAYIFILSGKDYIMAVDSNTKEIVKAITDLTKELKRIRKLMESWDEDPPINEADPDKYIV